MRFGAPRLLCGLVAVVAFVGPASQGCADDEPEPGKQRAETADRVAKLPPGWHKYVNTRAGFALARAPGWSVHTHGGVALLRSPDRLVAISISADRSAAAIEIPLDDYTHDAAKALPGLKHLEIKRANRFTAHYPARAVKATGTEDRVRQTLLFIAMRRDGFATYAVLVAANAERNTTYYSDEALRIARTLRGRPAG